MRRIEDGVHLPRPEICVAVLPDAQTAAKLGDVDSRVMDYVERAQPVFDAVRSLSGQLAGLLLLTAAGGKSAQGHPVFALLLEARDRLQGEIGGLTSPNNAMHHHRHLLRAAKAVLGAITLSEQALHRGDADIMDRLTDKLRRANQELHWATAALPGFAVVDLRQSCCALHLRSGAAG